MKLGDFTGLAEQYQRFRVGYSNDVLRAISALLPNLDLPRVVDVGAGTGIWSRQLAAHFGSCTAIEPNDDMRQVGSRETNMRVVWKKGSAEHTGEPDGSCAFVTMASSFHWANFDLAISEFHRILSPEGIFTCLWNPRVIKGLPLLEEIEKKVHEIVPPQKRKSSGSSQFVESLTENLTRSGHFKDLTYMEAPYWVRMSRESYLGAWSSVNDIRAQAGEDKFQSFMTFVEDVTRTHEYVDCKYLTRSWSVRKNYTIFRWSMQTIVISQRVVLTAEYPERRDALDQRWTLFLSSLGIFPLLMPNCLPDIVSWLKNFEVQGLILTGGNDLDCLPNARTNAPERDRTELKAVEYFEAKNLPVLGVCRGFQLLAVKYGSTLEMLPGHVDRNHPIDSVNEMVFPNTVNSFHHYGVKLANLPKELECLAVAEDNTVEAFRHRKKKQLAICWHPERETQFRPEDLRLFNNIFNGSK